jgi:hypothetical protein
MEFAVCWDLHSQEAGTERAVELVLETLKAARHDFGRSAQVARTALAGSGR